MSESAAVPKRGALRRLFADGGVFFAASAVTLVLVVAVNALIFSLLNQVLLSPLPYRDVERLHLVRPEIRIEGEQYDSAFSADEFASLRALPDAGPRDVGARFAAMQAGSATLSGDGAARKVSALICDGGLPEMLGLRMEHGSFAGFGAENPQPVVVVSSDFRDAHFGVDAEVLGKSLILDGQSVSVAGVLARDARAPVAGGDNNPDVWLPLHLQPAGADLFLDVVASVDPAEASREAVRARVDGLLAASRLDQAPIVHAGVQMLPLQSLLTAWAEKSLWIMQGVGLIVFLVAVGNIASVFLLRCEQRAREIVIHTSLGAGWRHVYWLIASELLLVCALSSLLGLALAYLAMPSFQGALFPDLPIAGVALDLVSALSVLLAVLVAGLAVAAVQVARFVGRDGMLGMLGGRTLTGSRALSRTQSAFIAGQAALSVLVVAVTVALGVHLRQQSAVDPGYRMDPGFVAVDPVGERIEPQHVEAALDALRARAGDDGAAVASAVPLAGAVAKMAVQAGDGGAPITANVIYADAAYFTLLGIAPATGRAMEPEDVKLARRVAWVNASLAKRLAGDADSAVGRWVVEPGGSDDDRYQVAGVVPELASINPFVDEGPTLYLPFDADAVRSVFLMVRGQGDVGGVFREAIAEARAPLVMADVATVAERFSAFLAPQYGYLRVVSAGALVAFVLSVVGLIGAVANVVAKRRREMALRILLGAGPRDLLAVTSAKVLWPCLIGTAVGLAAAYVVVRMLGAVFYGFAAPSLPGMAVVGLAAASLLFVLSAFPVWSLMRREVRVG